MAQCRLQAKSNWREPYTAVATNAYIRAGFEHPASPGPPENPKDGR